MKTPVHILATVRKPELLAAALLVFKTLRTGFPGNPVNVWGNGLRADAEKIIATSARNVGGQFTNLLPTIHDAWIEALIEENLNPFWICDTDVAFWSQLLPYAVISATPLGEPIHYSLTPPFIGRFEPSFEDEWTGTLHVARLHTAVMYIDPVAFRIATTQVRCGIPAPWGRTADFPFVRQHFIPRRNARMLCYDTLAGAYQAGLGAHFTVEENAAFDHLYCATYADKLPPQMAAWHRQVYANVELLRGAQAGQRDYFEQRKPKGELCPTIRE